MATPKKGNRFEAISGEIAEALTAATGSTTAFLLAAGLLILWASLGPVLDYSEAWQLAINTGTTIVTFLMIFLVQRTQNKVSLALQLKLNEIVAALEGASNRLISVEDLTEEELKTLRSHFRELAMLAKREGNLMKSHSVDEAGSRHRLKIEASRRS